MLCVCANAHSANSQFQYVGRLGGKFSSKSCTQDDRQQNCVLAYDLEVSTLPHQHTKKNEKKSVFVIVITDIRSMRLLHDKPTWNGYADVSFSSVIYQLNSTRCRRKGQTNKQTNQPTNSTARAFTHPHAHSRQWIVHFHGSVFFSIDRCNKIIGSWNSMPFKCENCFQLRLAGLFWFSKPTTWRPNECVN